ncbi:MAG: aminotransferase class V-fold PLP-dependent enzyme [Armatimonadetes bacterium]|nr:aminotransferase class V-fold PLP-dependent enzyme [Armatimonadota bacterium]
MDLTPKALRAQFPIKQHCAFFNHAAVAPIPACTADAVALLAAQQRDKVYSKYGDWVARLAEARRNLAALLGTKRRNIAFTKNTTSGLILATQGIPFEPGDNVIISSIEFPANVYPWLALEAQGVETRMVQPREGRILLDDVAAAMDANTRAVSLSWVQYSNGFRVDLASLSQLCADRGAWLVVDAIQGLGAIPIDVDSLGIDFLCADGHKWLLSVEGCGVLYVSDRAMEQMRPANVGWMSVKGAQDYGEYRLELRDDAGRFEEGTHNMLGGHALGASAGLLLDVGPERVWERIQQLTGRLVEGLLGAGCEILSPRGEGATSGIISFRLPGMAPETVVEQLAKRDIVVCARAGGVRVSPHFYNDEAEIDRLVEEVRRLSPEMGTGTILR